MLTRVQELFVQHPLEMAAALAGALVVALLGLWLLGIRRGFPALLFVSLLLILSGASSFSYLQVLGKGLLRWMALVGVAAVGGIYLRRARLPLNRPTAVHLGWVALFVLLAAAIPLSQYPRFAGLSVLAVGLMYIGAFVAVWYYTSEIRALVDLVEVLHGLALVVTVLGVLFLVVPGVQTSQAGRFQGFFNNPNWNGNMSAILLPVVLWKLRYPRTRLARHATAGLALLMCLNILFSGSRGALLGGAVAGLMAQWRLDRAKLTRYGLALLPLVVLTMVSPTGREYFGSRAEQLARPERIGTLTHRTEMWQDAWPEIREDLVIGTGLGTSRFILFEDPEAREGASQVGAVGAHLHSQHVLMLAETGVLGLALLWAFMLYVGFAGASIVRLRPSALSDMAFSLFCACVFVFADSFIHGWMLSAGSPFALLFWAIVAMFLKARRLAQAEPIASPAARASG